MNDLCGGKVRNTFYSQDMHAGPLDSMLLIDQIAALIRERIVLGAYKPGKHLSEMSLSLSYGVSRNTLREIFRILTKEGLLRHESNRGVFVITPEQADIKDVFIIRRIVECGAMLQAKPCQQGMKKMLEAVEQAEQCYDDGDWIRAGTANIAFHAAIVSLAGSPGLSRCFSQLMVKLRLIFGLLDDPQYLHASYIHMNRNILELLEKGENRQATDMLHEYLLGAEQMISTAYAKFLCAKNSIGR